MARGIAFWVVAFLFALLGAANADPLPAVKALSGKITELTTQLRSRSSERPLPLGPLIDLELAIDWRTDCKFVAGGKGPETDACRVRAIRTASDFLLSHGALTRPLATQLALSLGLLLDQEAAAWPQTLSGMLVESTSNLVTRMGDDDITALKKRLTRLARSLDAATGSASASGVAMSAATSQKGSDTKAAAVSAPAGSGVATLTTAAAAQKTPSTSDGAAKTSTPGDAKSSQDGKGGTSGDTGKSGGLATDATALTAMILEASDVTLKNDAISKALEPLRAEIELAVGCSVQSETIQDCHLTLALTSLTSLLVNSMGGTAPKTLSESRFRAVNEAVRPLLLSILDADKAAYIDLLQNRVIAIRTPDDKVKSDFRRMRGLIGSLVPLSAKINVIAAVFGDVYAIQPRRRTPRFLPEDRYCWAFRAVATACHGRASCLEKAAADVKLEIDAEQLCGYDPVPYAEDNLKSLLVIYSCENVVDPAIDDAGMLSLRSRLRQIATLQRRPNEHVAILHPGQSGGIRCSGVPGEDAASSSK